MLTLPILYYHKFCSPPAGTTDKDVYMEPARLERQLHLLKVLGYLGITLEEFMNWFESGKKPRGRCVVLTFDDGFTYNLTNALPILKRHAFATTIFVIAGYIGQRIKFDYCVHPKGENILSAERIRLLVREGIDVQSHGLSHRRLSALPDPRN